MKKAPARKHKTTRPAKVTPSPLKPVQDDPAQNPAFHRRILAFLNEAVSPEDLMYERVMVVHAEGALGHEGNPVHEDNPDAMNMKRKMVMGRDMATRLLEFREREYPLGFRNIKEVLSNKIFDIRR